MSSALILKLFPCRYHPSKPIQSVRINTDNTISLVCSSCSFCRSRQNPDTNMMSLSDFIHQATAEFEISRALEYGKSLKAPVFPRLQLIDSLFSPQKTIGNLSELEKAIGFLQKRLPHLIETLRQKTGQVMKSAPSCCPIDEKMTYLEQKEITRSGQAKMTVRYLELILFFFILGLNYPILGYIGLSAIIMFIITQESQKSEAQRKYSTNLDIPVSGTEDSAKLIPVLSEIVTCNKNGTKPSAETMTSYSEKLYQMISKESSYKELRKAENEEEHDYYESGCILNYHINRVQHLSSNKELIDAIQESEDLIKKYGKKLEPHPLYKLNKTRVNQETMEKDAEIRSKLQEAQKGSESSQKLEIIDIVTKLTKQTGIKMFLTDNESPKEFDCLHVMATGSLSDCFVKITFNDLNEKNFEKMAKDKIYASKVYDLARKALADSQMYIIQNKLDIKIVAIECDTHLIAIIIPENLTPNDPKQYQPVNGVTITTEPIIKFLSLNPNQFDPKGNMEWGKTFNPEKESRGGLDYYFPRGWKGYGLKVLGKYGSDDDWLTKWDRAGWSVAYHGVSSNPQNKIQSILNSQLLAGAGQAYAQSNDVNPLRPNGAARTVGTGVYFGKKIEVSESGYTETVTLEDGSRYKVILQCRLNPKEIRIPSSWEDAYVVPQGNNNIRPYRILVKRL